MIARILKYMAIDNEQVAIYVPDEADIKAWYTNANPKPDFPYWARIWPAAMALSACIVAQQNIFKGRRIVELGAGLGLPSLIAAKYAKSVLITDYITEPFSYITATIQHHQYTNCSTAVCNWKNITELPEADILLLSDINYAAEDIASIVDVIEFYIKKRTTIFLATPQRIVGRDFIHAVQQYIQQNETVPVKTGEGEVTISLYVLSL